MIFFIRGNVLDGNEALTKDNSRFFTRVLIGGKKQVQTEERPFAAPFVRTLPAEEAFEAVLASVGGSAEGQGQ
jgi:hypothetical protein